MTTVTLAASSALALLFSSPAASATSRSLEQRYISARDDYVRSVNEHEAEASNETHIDPLLDDHGRALKELESRLREIILAFVARGDRVLVITSPLKTPLEQFPECEARWTELDAKYQEAHRHRDAGEQAGARPERYREEWFDAYGRCYATALRTRPSFADLTHRAQALIDRLSGRR